MKYSAAIAAALVSSSAFAGFNNSSSHSVPAIDTIGLVALAAVIGVAGFLATRRSK